MTDLPPFPRSEGPSGWHAPPDVLARFARDPGGLDAVSAASVEGHLVACGACRAQVAGAAEPSDAAASWAAVADRIDRPRLSLVERLLGRLVPGGGLARVVTATPALRLTGLAAIGGLAVAASAMARAADAAGPFLVLAPLVPLAAVAASFAPAAEPAGEAGVATPLHGAGLALRRAAVVVGITFTLLGLAALAVPGVSFSGAAWVLPALALALGSLALGTWWRVEVCAGGLACAWLALTASVRLTEARRIALPDTAVFGATGQVAALVATLLALAVLAGRFDRYATLEACS